MTGILLGFLYIKIKNPVYESRLKIEIENIPPFYSDKTSIIKSTYDFKNNVLSKTNFDNWKSNLKKSSLVFNSFSETIIIDGTELTSLSRDSLLVKTSQERDKINFIIKTNNLQILDEFYNYNHYISKLLEKEYVFRAKKELKLISSKIKDFPETEPFIIDKTLPNERFITSIEMGKNVFNIQRPSVPKKISPINLLVYGISSILGAIIGLIIVFGRIHIGQNKT